MHRRWQRVLLWLLDHPLAGALLLGGLARLLAATVGYGFHARDDYFHILEPALRWSTDSTFNWDTSDVPGAGIRSHLVPRVVWLLLQAAHFFHVEEPRAALIFLAIVAALYSLLTVALMHFTARRLVEHKAAVLATYFAALHFAMPYAGTRLLIEAMAMPFLLLGVYFCTWHKARYMVAAGLSVGLAMWLRYQTGAAAVGLFFAMLAQQNSAGRPWGKTLWLRATSFAAGLLAALAAQGLFDWVTTGGFLQPLWRNVAYNLHPPVPLSRSSSFSYLGLWLLLTVPPATLWLLPALVRAARRLPLVAWPFVSFVAIHSLIPHKEDRFMLPVLPLFLLLLAAALHELESLRPAATRFARLWPLSRRLFWTLHALALVLAISHRSQANLQDALLALRQDRELRAIVSLGPEIQDYFLKTTSHAAPPSRRRSDPDAAWFATTLAELHRLGYFPNRFLSFAADTAAMRQLLQDHGLACTPPQEISGWWLDRLIYRLNPRRNKRRSPIAIWHCNAAELAPHALL